MNEGNPEGQTGYIKIIAKNRDGERAIIIARHQTLPQAIALGVNGPDWGRLILVKEIDPEKWPFVQRVVTKIPKTSEWKIEAKLWGQP